MANTFTDANPATGGAADSRLASLTEVKAYLGVIGSGDDIVIGDLIDAATEAMEQHAGRRLVSTTVTEVLDGTGERYLWLKEQAESIVSIKIDSNQDFDSATPEAADTYCVEGCAVDRYAETWPVGLRNIQVVYEAGYVTVPDDVKHACKVQVARLYADWQTVKEGANTLETENVEGWSRTWRPSDGLAEDVCAILSHHIPVRA